ncbi:MAG: TRAP transporter small permease [Deltaproteobacteria bacterium]|nr:TRAP transporter small permease [Deltaproteobacteria bacterium]
MVRKIVFEVYDNFEKYFCAFLTVLMVFCLGSQVFFRFVLNAALTWSEELSRFAFVWLVYMGAILGAKERIHIRVTAPQLLLPERFRRFVNVFADVIWVVINLFFAHQGVLQVKHLFQFSYISPALQWNMAYIYCIVPAGFLLMSYRIIEGHLRDYRRGGFEALGVDLLATERTVEKRERS